MRRPVEVLLVGLNYAPEHTGIGPYTTGVARALAAAGHRVRVVAGFPYYPAWRLPEGYRAGLIRREADGPVEVTRLRHHVPRSSTGLGRIAHEASFAAHAWLRGVPGRPDVVVGVSPSLLSLVAARALARRSGAAFGAVVQDVYSAAATEVAGMGARGAAAVRALESAQLRAADGVVVAHGRFTGTIASLGVASERISVIENWVHIAAPAERRRAAVRARLGWRPDEVVALHAGNMGVKQDLTNLVAAGRLAGQRERFVLMGDGAQRAAIRAAAERVPAVSVLDPVPDTDFPDVLAAADVLLVNELPGVREMCVPSKFTSYFMAARPIVAATEADSAAAAELAASGAGTRVPPGEPRAVLAAVRALGADPALGDALGRCGRSYGDSRRQAESALAQYTAWVERLADAR
ncbi:glycosyltransferase [Actinokineospora guangxiensis]|uniref:Glycosyltransferase n=1 Tax=Actinokineospora guangxiensis TaxID=1490288 RepID=A0ABW0EL12_9PSEU